MAEHLAEGCRKVRASDNAFAAVTKSGRVVTWGVKDAGGDSFLTSSMGRLSSMGGVYDGVGGCRRSF